MTLDLQGALQAISGTSLDAQGAAAYLAAAVAAYEEGGAPSGTTGLLMGKATKTSTTSGFTVAGGVQDIPDLSVTFTAVAGRRYRIETFLRVTVNQSSGTMVPSRTLCTIWAAAQIGVAYEIKGPANSANTLMGSGSGFTYDEPAGGSITYKARVLPLETGTTASVDASASGPCILAVYDDGPV